MLRRAPQGHERIMSERSMQHALGVGCPRRNHGHSDNPAARGIDPMITLGSDREIGAAALAKARAGVPVATIPR
jgi:hypothetical protein